MRPDGKRALEIDHVGLPDQCYRNGHLASNGKAGGWEGALKSLRRRPPRCPGAPKARPPAYDDFFKYIYIPSKEPEKKTPIFLVVY